jgi:hypothetical protein
MTAPPHTARSSPEEIGNCANTARPLPGIVVTASLSDAIEQGCSIDLPVGLMTVFEDENACENNKSAHNGFHVDMRDPSQCN